jgi:hypothetical protein
VRGDSIRDLYAKTLALLGLGVLAGTGALVDYWPVGGVLPATASPWVLVQTPVPLLADAVGQPAPPEPMRAAPVPVMAAVREPAPGLPLLAVSDASLLPAGRSASLSEPLPEPAYVFAEATLDAFDDLAIVNVALNTGAVVTLPKPRSSGVVAADDGDNVIYGAFKKTGSSIVRGGAKTGTSVLDAVRFVTSAFRRVLPNN